MNKKFKNVRLINRLKLVALFLSMLILVGMTSVSCINDKSPASTESPSSSTPDGKGEITYWKVLYEGVAEDSGVLGLTEVTTAVSGTRHDIMFGLDYGLALKSDGTVWSWNINVGGSMQASEPIQVSGLSKITAISTGMGNSLALDSDGKVWYWYAFGDLPSGIPPATTTTTPLTQSPTPASRNPTPEQVMGLGKVTAISSGLRFSLVLLTDGTVWAWGENGWGQLGDGTITDSDAPVQVKNLSGVIAISAGHYHSLALKADGTVWAWGDNESGELGNGTTINSYVPVQVSKLDGIEALEAGEAHSLALRKDGTVWSWGNNENGQAGNGTQNGKDDPAVTIPVKVNNLSNVVAISEGGLPGGGAELNGGMVKYGAGYCLALKSDSTVWTWGASGWYSEPWNNPHNNLPVPVSNFSDVKTIVGGGNYAMVIIHADSNSELIPSISSPAPESHLPFNVNVSTAPSHLPGEQIMFGIAIHNLSSGTITIDPFSPAKWIKSVDRNEIVFSSPGGQSTYDLQSGMPFLPTKDTWEQKDNNGQQVAPGWYEIGYEYIVIDQGTGERYTATPTARFQIVDPDSAMNKVMDVNQSTTAEDMTITLKRIEINAVGTKVYTFITPPGYSLTTEHPPYQMESLMTNSMAEYSVDGGDVKQIKSGGGKADAEGITLTWDNLEPMPLGSKELTFIITQLGDLKGRWEFKIKLN
ncbi:MAG: hypothetical protein PHH57_05095 [Candidatus Omnitrophica bacterium]|nr:hypothetical protein [Candidatus Omnitrophota bacterium]